MNCLDVRDGLEVCSSEWGVGLISISKQELRLIHSGCHNPVMVISHCGEGRWVMISDLDMVIKMPKGDVF